MLLSNHGEFFHSLLCVKEIANNSPVESSDLGELISEKKYILMLKIN